MKYNHDETSINKAIGRSVEEVFAKGKELLIAMPKEEQHVTSRQIEMFESNFSKQELAIMVAILGEKLSPPKVKITKVGKDGISPEVLAKLTKALEEKFGKEDSIQSDGIFEINIPSEECNCPICQMERKIKKIPTMPLSKGGNA